MANWSELPSDILEHMTIFLPIQDRHRFGAVCKNWGYVAKAKRHPPAQQIPWLALGEDQKTKKRKFYNLPEDRHYYLDVPELHGKVICGSKYGWLFTLDRKLNFHLVNPLTRECYDLPSPPPYFEGYFDRDKHDLALYLEAESDNEEAHGNMRMRFENLQRILVVKATLDYDPSKRSDFTVLILYGKIETPSFWRPGNDGWTDIPDFPSHLDDIAFYKGKFYAVSSPVFDRYSAVYTIDVGLEPKATRVGPCVPLHGDPNFVMGLIPEYSVATYIVDLDGEFLLVERFLEMFEHRVTTEFVIHKIKLDEKSYTTCRHIDRHAIFLGSNSVVVISPDQFPDCTKDAIYFTDTDCCYVESYGAEDLGIYDLIGKNIMPYYQRDIFHAPLAAPIWFAPNPR